MSTTSEIAKLENQFKITIPNRKELRRKKAEEKLPTSYYCLDDTDNIIQLSICSVKAKITNNQLTTIGNITTLKELYLSANQIENITPLQKLINLEILYLSNNEITNITPLKNLTKLKELWL